MDQQGLLIPQIVLQEEELEITMSGEEEDQVMLAVKEIQDTADMILPTGRPVYNPYFQPSVCQALGPRTLAPLVSKGRYRKALDSAGADRHGQYWMLHKLLCPACHSQGRHSQQQGAEHERRDVLVSLMSSEMVKRMSLISIFDLLVERYFPQNVQEFWDTFIEHGAGVVDKTLFLSDVLAAQKRKLRFTMQMIDSCSPDQRKQYRKQFGQLVLTAVKPLRCDPGCFHPPDEPVAWDFGGKRLFAQAVSQDLLDEAVLLYDTWSVCPRELTALAHNQNLHQMITGDDNAPKAVFLRQVLKHPPSLLSCAELRVAGLFGDGLKGKLDRARSLGLPPLLWKSLVKLHQTKQFMGSVNRENANIVNEETVILSRIQSVDTDHESAQLIDF